MLLALLLSAMVPLSAAQCLTAVDQVRKVSAEAHEGLLQSELQFSADLVHTVSSLQPDKNVFFCPTSVFKALLLAYFLSANQTEQSLRNVLHLASDQDKLDLFGAYTVDNYYQKLRSIKENGYKLSSANRIYVDKHIKVQNCFKVLFMEEIYPANFQENSKGVVRKINNWVAGQTRNVIKDFLSEDQVTKDTELVLVNAAYFKGSWKSEFLPEVTRESEFHLSNGKIVLTPMMTQENKFKHRIDKKLGVEVLELPYSGDEISMFILLPLKASASAVQDVIKRLDSEALRDVAVAMDAKAPHPLSVTIPKFTVTDSLDLTTILESMGVGDLFQSSADLSTLTGSKGLSFSDAVHKAKIKVDEKGTEAAAATSFISARIGTPTFIADHPFIYTLYDKTSNILLFFGVFNGPEST